MKLRRDDRDLTAAEKSNDEDAVVGRHFVMLMMLMCLSSTTSQRLAMSSTRYLSLRTHSQTLIWDLINMQNILNHVSDRSSHLSGKRRKKISAFGPRRLLYRPKLRRHSWRICFFLHLLKRKLKRSGLMLKTFVFLQILPTAAFPFLLRD